jgi:hypothetical protein
LCCLACFAEEPKPPSQIELLKAEVAMLRAQLGQSQLAVAYWQNIFGYASNLRDQDISVKLAVPALAQSFERLKGEAQKACNGTLDVNYACVPDKRGTK